jgi:hypothetical protein
MSWKRAAAQKTGRHENWLALLDALDVQFLVLDVQRDGKLLKLVRSNPKWMVDCTDGQSVLFTRTGALESIQAAA